VVYPDPRGQRRPWATGPGSDLPAVPPFFGNDTVLDRPQKAYRGPESAVAPGVHASRTGGHAVVWWDPTALALGKDHDAGLRQQKLLEADAAGTVSEQGVQRHAAWRAQRDRLVEEGARPSLRVRTATEAALAASVALAVLHEEVATRDPGRPHHKRFGSLVHAILAEVPLDADGAGVERVALQQGRLLGAPDDERAAAAVAVAAALAHPLMRRAAAAGAAGCRREVPVSLDRDGELIEGVVDLAFEEGGEWFVVDYKTDAEIARGGLEAYEAQVSSYAEAIAAATGRPAWPVLFRV
jgi:ATP-dependent exoDNAse (exonuclease V) beta subunit